MKWEGRLYNTTGDQFQLSTLIGRKLTLNFSTCFVRRFHSETLGSRQKK